MFKGPNLFIKISMFGWIWGIFMSALYHVEWLVAPPAILLGIIFSMGASITWQLIQANEKIEELQRTRTFD